MSGFFERRVGPHGDAHPETYDVIGGIVCKPAVLTGQKLEIFRIEPESNAPFIDFLLKFVGHLNHLHENRRKTA